MHSICLVLRFMRYASKWVVYENIKSYANFTTCLLVVVVIAAHRYNAVVVAAVFAEFWNIFIHIVLLYK